MARSFDGVAIKKRRKNREGDEDYCGHDEDVRVMLFPRFICCVIKVLARRQFSGE